MKIDVHKMVLVMNVKKDTLDMIVLLIVLLIAMIKDVSKLQEIVQIVKLVSMEINVFMNVRVVVI